MSLTSDNGTDWQYIEGIETVSIVPQNPLAAEIPNVTALKTSRSGSPLFKSGTFATDPGEDVWHLWEQTIAGGYQPKNGDVVKDAAGTQWTLLTVGYSKRTGKYFSTARQKV